MNRAPSINGHAAESARARGGYDAYFAPTNDLADAAVAPGPAPETRQDAENSTPADPVIGAPREPQAPPGESGPRPTQAGVTPPPVASGPPPRQANAAAAHPNTPPAPTNAPPQASTPAPHPPAAPPGAAQQTAQQHSAGQRSAEQYQADYSAATPSQAIARNEAASANQEWSSSSATPWVPERVDHSAYEPTPRIEVLPAALSSIELLADISAAKRAQLRSNSGVRGALNKVGFNLGLSPAEQRAEDRKARIRRQLTTTYQIAVISVKGGVGRTTTAATLGSTFASLRPDRVVAIDANPDFGDLSTRTCRHPYGLTLRDLAQSQNLDAFSAVQSFTSINSADLAVIASPWSTEATEALSGREYSTAVEVLRKHFNLLVVDCGTGVLDSATATVLQTSDAVVVVTPATVGGVTGAVATLNWLSSHGLQHLIAKSIVGIVHHQPLKPTVDVDAIEKLFETAQRPTCVLPYDAHLAEGGEIDLRLLEKETVLAFEELAAWLADGFPGYLAGGADNSGDRGGWR
ncbi:MinD/ParA family protein [Nocardia implantans]|uniref:MinD/ParA family protein n=1 Tax=Nocardia implantans TaxID=3108168 RepID=A0ABU6AQ09_9NOCA|nr:MULTISPECIES: MinD/ParA family protein [unclassified Nocardia]MBF6189799.1 MinD/ParA family protein [Nocardia beijingensis]MEA3526970.1 MinD/ParA family protein [Nocardia sp. CDC192]MEB3509452.1 MinD/ParA family protein [Nocardia sp. CDC186]